MKSHTKYQYQKRIKELENDLYETRTILSQYKGVMLRLYSWLTPFAKVGNECPNASYGLDQMKELLK